MPQVILRGSKDGRKVSRLILEGSSSNPTRFGVLNGEPFEVTDEEFEKYDSKYVLELASNDGKPDDESSPQPEAEVIEDDSDDNEDDEK